MKTVKMTRAQLRVAIIEKRGEGELREVLDYLRDMNAAIVLLREMPMAGLDYYESDLVTLTWSADDGDIHGVDNERGNEAEAVALAWWQWKTGEKVELVSE